MPFNPLDSPQEQRGPYLPSFEQAMLTYEYEDSMRLPTYQGRPLGRFHPYRRCFPYRLEQSSYLRFLNTIYDEEGIFLGAIPPLSPPVASATGSEAEVAAHPHHEDPAPEPEPEQNEARVNHLGSAIMMAFIQGVQRAIEAEGGAQPNTAPGPEPETNPEAEVVAEAELEYELVPSSHGKE